MPPLHRAFSLFLFSNNALLVQRRADGKLTFPSLWSNTCCSHPLLSAGTEETIIDAAKRKALHELNLDLGKTKLFTAGRILYSATSSHDFAEHELDHLVFGRLEGQPTINPNLEEVQDTKWATPEELAKIENITPWFKLLLDHILIPNWKNISQLDPALLKNWQESPIMRFA